MRWLEGGGGDLMCDHSWGRTSNKDRATCIILTFPLSSSNIEIGKSHLYLTHLCMITRNIVFMIIIDHRTRREPSVSYSHLKSFSWSSRSSSNIELGHINQPLVTRTSDFIFKQIWPANFDGIVKLCWLRSRISIGNHVKRTFCYNCFMKLKCWYRIKLQYNKQTESATTHILRMAMLMWLLSEYN